MFWIHFLLGYRLVAICLILFLSTTASSDVLQGLEDEIIEQATSKYDKFKDYVVRKVLDESISRQQQEENDNISPYLLLMLNKLDEFRRKPNKQPSNGEKCKRLPMFRYNSDDADKLLDTLSLMTSFWNKNYKSIIIDGLFGMRSAEGSLKRVVDKMSKSYHLYPKVSHVYHRLHEVCKKTYDFIKNRKDTYSQSFLKIVDRPFRFKRPWRNQNKELIWKTLTPKEMNEGESDHCIQQLLGVDKTHGRCYITDKCLKEETVKRASDYYLTHQALYFIAGETHGCRPELRRQIGGRRNLEHLYDVFGSNIYAQMLSKSLVKPNWDIVGEQGMICISLGIVECARVDLLRNALNWVSHEGCISDELPTHRNEKRVDVEIGHCSQHLTSVAMGFYANHLDFMFDPPSCDLIS